MPAIITRDAGIAAKALIDGRLVAMPTETVYGLAANALDPIAVARVFEVKQRPAFDPLIVHVSDAARAAELTTHFSERARALAAAFWPGPLTLVLPKARHVPDIVTSGLSTVAVRVPDHVVARQLLASVNFPLAAPSANLFGRLSPTTAEHVADQLGDRIDVILDGGPCRVGVESTVLVPDADPPLLLRPGGVPREDLESIVGAVSVLQAGATNEAAMPSPGMTPQHYAPVTQLRLLPALSLSDPGPQVGILAFQHAPAGASGPVEVLSASGDMREAAANLFAALRRLDARGLTRIDAEQAPDAGLGVAINDRLRRAARECIDLP